MFEYDHYDDAGYKRDKWENLSTGEVERGLSDGTLKEYSGGKYVYNPKTGEDFHRDGTKR